MKTRKKRPPVIAPAIIPALPEIPVMATQNLNLDYSDSIIRSVNEELRAMQLIGPVNDVMHSAAFHTLSYLAGVETTPIRLSLFTYGGDIMSGLAIHDLIHHLGKTTPIDILATGACMSMGVIIAQAARERLAYANANFMLHELQGSNQGDLGELRDRHRHMLALQKRLNDILSERTGMSLQKINKLIERKDCYISAQEAVELNLIDRII